MRKWLVIAFLLGILTTPVSAGAQGEVKLASLEVQLWPEYDQPSMLLIYDFTLTEGIGLPVNVAIRIPKDANRTALTLYVAGQPRPTTRAELAALGLISPLAEKETERIRRG